MKRLKQLGSVSAVSAIVALSFGPPSASAAPTLEDACHGYVVSQFAHTSGGLGRVYREGGFEPGVLGEHQRIVAEACKALP